MVAVNVKEFNQAVGKLSAAANKRLPNLQIMFRTSGNMLELYVESGDLFASMQLNVTGGDEINCFCDLKELNALVKKFKHGGDVVNVYQTEKSINFVYNNFEFQLDTIDRGGPFIPDLEFDYIGEFSKRESYVLFELMPQFVPGDYTNSQIEYVYLKSVGNDVSITAANGYQLSRVEYQREMPDNTMTLMIPQAALNILGKFFLKTGFTLYMSAAGKYVKYESGNSWIINRNPIDLAKYPEIDRVIDNVVKNSLSTVDMYVADLNKLVKGAVQFSKDSIAGFVVDGGIPKVKILDLNTQKLLRDFVELPAYVEGGNVKTYLNCNYVLSALQGCEFECKIQLGPNSAMFNSDYIMDGVTGKYMGVVMGLQIRD